MNSISPPSCATAGLIFESNSSCIWKTTSLSSGLNSVLLLFISFESITLIIGFPELKKSAIFVNIGALSWSHSYLFLFMLIKFSPKNIDSMPSILNSCAASSELEQSSIELNSNVWLVVISS